MYILHLFSTSVTQSPHSVALGTILTFTPLADEQVTPKHSVQGSPSLGSILSNSCTRRVVTYDASMVANCSANPMVSNLSLKEGYLPPRTPDAIPRSSIERQKLLDTIVSDSSFDVGWGLFWRAHT